MVSEGTEGDREPDLDVIAQAIHVYRHHALLSVVEQLAARLINLLSSVKLVSQP